MDELGPLGGYTIGITAARRRRELGAALERRGARVVYGPAISIVPLADDREMLAATRRCIDAPPEIVVVTTGIGFRGWLEAADGWGLAQPLLERLAAAVVVTRGPKSRGAVRAAGLTEAWSPESESSREVIYHLLAGDLTGRRIAVQLHGEPLPDLVTALHQAGADVVTVPVYRWTLPDDVAPLRQLVAAVAARGVDAAAFTSAPASASFLRTATEMGLHDRVVAALRTEVVACCIGGVTAAPLHARGVPVCMPDRPRLGALVREIAEAVPARRARRVRVNGYELELRGHLVVLDGVPVPVGVTGMALLRLLVAQPGRVVPRSRLLDALAGEGQAPHAVEVAIGRLRAALGEADLITTVVKRGYRLACDKVAPLGAGTV